ncbi:MAG TPA: cupredoxin domain-containing protein, partial [Thermomicrobiales bacterium]|nr:cupredoxin domain-containing protein [Thermomicrobiales bacterium]
VLAEQGGNGDTSRVLSVVPGEDGQWFIDEVGRMTEPEVDALGTPIVDQEEISARATEYASTPVTDRFPLELTVSITDIASASESSTFCAVAGGTPIPCTVDASISFIGPWGYNEIPADIPFTFTFVNASDRATHITSPELAIDVEVPAGQQVDVEVDADPGNYEIVFTQGDATSTWTFTFEPKDGRFSMG